MTNRTHLISAITMVLAAAGFADAALAKSDRPVALVEEISDAPDAEVGAFDYVFENDKIDLRPNGRAVFTYFDLCLTEVVIGGVAEIEREGIDLKKDATSVREPRACARSQVALDADASEAGASVKRVSPFDADAWQEAALAVPRPFFKWDPGKDSGPAQLTLYYMDADPIRVVWQGTAKGAYFDYPEDGPAFEVGMPYRMVAMLPGGDVVDGVFSIDPGLDLPHDLVSRLVPLD